MPDDHPRQVIDFLEWLQATDGNEPVPARFADARVYCEDKGLIMGAGCPAGVFVWSTGEAVLAEWRMRKGERNGMDGTKPPPPDNRKWVPLSEIEGKKLFAHREQLRRFIEDHPDLARPPTEDERNLYGKNIRRMYDLGGIEIALDTDTKT